MQVHSPVLIGSCFIRGRDVGVGIFESVVLSLTSDPTQTQLAGYQGQEVSTGPSLVQNIPCRRKDPEGLHLYGGFLHVENDENC